MAWRASHRGSEGRGCHPRHAHDRGLGLGRARGFLALALPMCVGLALGCGGKAGKSEMSAYPSLSSLEDDPIQRNEQLDSANQRPGPEQQANKSEGQLKAETVAATAAAIIGSMFSTSQNAVIGVRSSFEETPLIVVQPSTESAPEAASDSSAPPPGACLLLLSTRPASCDEHRSTP